MARSVRLFSVLLIGFALGCVGPRAKMSPPVTESPVARSTPTGPQPEAVVKAYPVEPAPAPEVVPIMPGPDAATPARPRQGLLGAADTGAPVYVSDFRGKLVLANFWTSWCPPCWGEMPHLEAIRRDYAKRGVVVVAVNQREDPDAIAAFVQGQDVALGFPMLSDASGMAGRERGVNSVPTTLLFDHRGLLSRRYTGMFGVDVAQMRRDIDRLLRNRDAK